MTKLDNIREKYGTKFRFVKPDGSIGEGKYASEYMVVDTCGLFGSTLAMVDLKYGILSSFSAIDSILDSNVVISAASPL